MRDATRADQADIHQRAKKYPFCSAMQLRGRPNVRIYVINCNDFTEKAFSAKKEKNVELMHSNCRQT